MPLIGGLLSAIYFGLISFLAAWFTKRIALTLAAIILVTTITVTMVTGINTLFSNIAQSVPPVMSTAASWVVPSNFSACLGAIIAAQLLRWIYDWNKDLIFLKTS